MSDTEQVRNGLISSRINYETIRQKVQVLNSATPDAVAAPDAVQTKSCGCGSCSCAVTCLDSKTGDVSSSTRLIIVAMALICSTIAMGCNLAVVQPEKGSAINGASIVGNGLYHNIWSNEDKVLVAAFW